MNDYTDLVERLRALVILDEVRSDNPLGREAADEIERLRAEVEELRFELKEAEARQPCDDAEFGMKP